MWNSSMSKHDITSSNFKAAIETSDVFVLDPIIFMSKNKMLGHIGLNTVLRVSGFNRNKRILNKNKTKTMRFGCTLSSFMTFFTLSSKVLNRSFGIYFSPFLIIKPREYYEAYSLE